MSTPVEPRIAPGWRHCAMRCSNKSCTFLAHSDFQMGTFCCKRCHWTTLRPRRNLCHGHACEKRRADASAVRPEKCVAPLEPIDHRGIGLEAPAKRRRSPTRSLSPERTTPAVSSPITPPGDVDSTSSSSKAPQGGQSGDPRRWQDHGCTWRLTDVGDLHVLEVSNNFSASMGTTIYAGTAQWWRPEVKQLLRGALPMDLLSWIKQEHNGSLLRLVHQGACLKVIIPGKEHVDSQEIQELAASITGRCVILGASAGGLLALQLLQHCELAVSCVAVSPGPLAHQDWTDMGAICDKMRRSLQGTRKRAAIYWAKCDKAEQQVTQTLAGQSVEFLRMEKGHVGMWSKELFAQVCEHLEALSEHQEEECRRSGRVVRHWEDNVSGQIMDGKMRLYHFCCFGRSKMPDVGSEVCFTALGSKAFEVEPEGAPQQRTFCPDLVWARNLFRRHACRSREELFTHSSMLGGRDPLCQGTGKYSFPDNKNTRGELALAMQAFHKDAESGGAKLYLCEHPSPVYAFCEDLDVIAPLEKGLPSLMRTRAGGHDWELLKWRATALHRIFPHLPEEMRCVVFSASGFYRGCEQFKESYHLVWPKLLVTKETAKQIRDHTLDTFEELTAIHNHPVAQLLQTAQQYDESNSWPRIFDATTTRPSIGLRMAYSDKRSVEPGTKAETAHKVFFDENRPVLPVAELEFEFSSGECSRAVVVATNEEKQPWEWALRGMVRREEGQQPVSARPAKRPRRQPTPPRKPWRGPGSHNQPPGGGGGWGGGGGGWGGGWGGGRQSGWGKGHKGGKGPKGGKGKGGPQPQGGWDDWRDWRDWGDWGDRWDLGPEDCYAKQAAETFLKQTFPEPEPAAQPATAEPKVQERSWTRLRGSSSEAAARSL
ncbi:unnamed protein product [Effrenium voratum]|nr:unnamed protein product [Effrenium voratum]